MRWCLLLLSAVAFTFGSCSAIISNRTGDLIDLFLHYDESNADGSGNNQCSFRLYSSLEKLRKRQPPVTSGFIDLSGYALHQTLRRAPFDMYVTDIKVRTPGTGNWVRVEKCHFSNTENRLLAQLLFNDIAVTGNVRLFQENSLMKNPGQQVPAEFCSMTARLKRAGLGLNAFPTRGRSKGIGVRTEANFVDPNYLSVHAHGCTLDKVLKREDVREVSTDAGHISHRYLETQIQQKYRLKHLVDDIRKGNQQEVSGEMESKLDESETSAPEVRIITLAPNIPGMTQGYQSNVQLHREDDSDLNDLHKERILSAKFQNERNKLNAVLHVKNLIAQQANQVFQAHGPFSQFQSTAVRRPLFEENFPDSTKFQNAKPGSFISTITELDENLAPVRPVQHAQQDALFTVVNDKISNPQGHLPVIQTQTEDLSHEMEDMFLRGVKTLLTRYLEKQLEIPLKEALMVSIGYTVSYG